MLTKANNSSGTESSWHPFLKEPLKEDDFSNRSFRKIFVRVQVELHHHHYLARQLVLKLLQYHFGRQEIHLCLCCVL